MRKIFTFLFVMLFVTSAFAQTQVDVSTGAGYANDVYYSFENGTLKTVARASWDLAFTTKVMDVTILANTGNGLLLYPYTKGDISDWDAVDTTGMEWKALYNSVETWDEGAFNTTTTPSGHPDYSWGVYNSISHDVNGDSLYILQLANGDFKKLAIVQKHSSENQWTFKYADLDGQNEVSENFDADDYDGQTFVWYSIVNGNYTSYEPEESWDLLFTHYFDYNIPYYVTGVKTKGGYKIQEVSEVSQSEYEDYDFSLSSSSITTIGSDWKSFNMGTFQYEVADDLVYFLKDTIAGEEAPVWKLYFTGFTGSASGTFSFTQEKMGVTAVSSIETQNVSVYPNPVSDIVNFIINMEGNKNIEIYNLAGQKVYSKNLNGGSAFEKLSVNISSFPTGIYNALIHSGNKVESVKFIRD